MSIEIRTHRAKWAIALIILALLILYLILVNAPIKALVVLPLLALAMLGTDYVLWIAGNRARTAPREIPLHMRDDPLPGKRRTPAPRRR